MVEHPYAFPYTSDGTCLSTQRPSAQVLLQQPAYYPLPAPAQWEHQYGGAQPNTLLRTEHPLGIRYDHAQAPLRDLCIGSLLPGHYPLPPEHNHPGTCHIDPQLYETKADPGNRITRARIVSFHMSRPAAMPADPLYTDLRSLS